MATDDSITNWTELQEFKGVDLTSSYVLSWGFSKDTLQLDVDVCLTPRHPLYEPPRPSEDAFILPAVIEFPACTRIDALGWHADRADMRSLADQLAHGRINSLQRIAEGVYRIDGKFGRVIMHADRPLLRLRARDD